MIPMASAQSLWPKAAVLAAAFGGTFGVVRLIENGISSCERAHPELRAMVPSRAKFLLVLRQVKRVPRATPDFRPEQRYYNDASDEKGQCLQLGVLALPFHTYMIDFISVKDMLGCPRLAREAFGGEPCDSPIRSKEDLEKAYERFPILRMIDREVFPFRARFSSGAKLELRRKCLPADDFVLHVRGVPPVVSESIQRVLDAIREANGLPRSRTLDELEWKI